MSMCAGVQKLSRPMERCQEMSQCTPVMAQVTAATAHQTYQGTADVVVSRTGTETVADNSDSLSFSKYSGGPRLAGECGIRHRGQTLASSSLGRSKLWLERTLRRSGSIRIGHKLTLECTHCS